MTYRSIKRGTQGMGGTCHGLARLAIGGYGFGLHCMALFWTVCEISGIIGLYILNPRWAT